MIPRNAPQTVADVPILQWASGRTEARPASGSRFAGFAGFVGFHSEAGKDEALDTACQQGGVARIEIRHPRPSGHQIVTHWAFGEQIRFHPITAGPPATTISGCLRLTEATAAAGLGLAWPTGDKSRLAVRGLILVSDTPVLLQLSVKSTMTDYLLSALIDHIRVCETADGLIKREQHPEIVALHELALPFKAGDERSVGKGETTLITPLVSAHPAEPDKAHITNCWRSKATHEAALHAWEGVQAWAAGYGSGETNGDSHLDESAPLAKGVRRVRPGVVAIEELPL